jgi:hypothetical protein
MIVIAQEHDEQLHKRDINGLDQSNENLQVEGVDGEMKGNLQSFCRKRNENDLIRDTCSSDLVN